MLNTKQIDKLIKAFRAYDRIDGVTITSDGISCSAFGITTKAFEHVKDYALTVIQAGIHAKLDATLASLIPTSTNLPLTDTSIAVIDGNTTVKCLKGASDGLTFVNADYFDLLNATFGGLSWYGTTSSSVIVGKKNNETVAILGPMRPTSYIGKLNAIKGAL